jgi:(2R)-ethylmalonyl-CoA mutase
VQLPAWNEALGLPRPWDQQWSLRAQQIMAYETDLLEYGDILNGSSVVEAKTSALADDAWREVEGLLASPGGVLEAIESGAIKERLVASNAERLLRIERGEQIVVGVNKFTETEPSPLGGAGAIFTVNPRVQAEATERLAAWRSARDTARVKASLEALRNAARAGENVVPPSIDAAKAGVTTGEWAGALREVFGEYRAPTGIVGGVSGTRLARAGAGAHGIEEVRAAVRALGEKLGRVPKMLVGKPGLDGHSNGAEQIALKARDCGFEVVYEGIRVTPEQLVASAIEEGVHLVGLSVLSGSHLELVPPIVAALRAGGSNAPVVVGGIIPEPDAKKLQAVGVARVFTPKDYELVAIMRELVELVGDNA